MNSVWNSISVLNRVLNIDCSSNTDLCLGLQAGATRTRFRFRGCRGLRDNRPCSSPCHLPLDSCLGHRIADHFASSYHHIPARRKHHVTHFSWSSSGHYGSKTAFAGCLRETHLWPSLPVAHASSRKRAVASPCAAGGTIAWKLSGGKIAATCLRAHCSERTEQS